MRKKGKENEPPSQETFEPLPVEAKTPATAVLLLSSTEEDVLIKACDAIYTFAEKGDDNKVSLLGFGAMAPLCQLITHSNKLVRGKAIIALGILATHGDGKNALKRLDVIPSIIDKLLPEEDVVIHEFATLCLASLSVDTLCKVQIFDNKGLRPLIQLLSSPDPDVEKNSLEVIFNLVQDYPSRQAVHELGGIPLLLDLLQSDFPVIQRLAIKTLQHVTTDKDTRDTFREKQGFEQFMDILSNTNFGDLHYEALQVVANCLSDDESIQQIHQNGGLTRLMEFVVTPNTSEIQSKAVKCITRIAQNFENRELLYKQNVEKVLVQILAVENVPVKTAICKAVSAMSFHLPSKDRLRDLGGIPAVVKCLKIENVELRGAATQALLNLTHGNQLNALALYEAGGHRILVQQLKESHPTTVADSAATLCNMAEQEDIHCSILSNGAIKALVELLKSQNTQILVNTTQCLAVLASDAEVRVELRGAGGLQPLVSLLSSFNKEVLHNTCFAIKVCASDLTTAVEMCKFGALDMLLDINQSVHRRSNFSKMAMISLLKSNISVKYSLTGHLATTDIIKDGFYDAGKAHEGGRILTLEELSKQPVNQHRSIIFVSTIAGEAVDLSEDRNSSLSVRNAKEDRKTPRKKKKDSKHKADTQNDNSAERQSNMVDDVSLRLLVKQAKESILSLRDERKQYAALAWLVSEAMGGAVEMEKLYEFPWVLHLSELKFKLQSNIVPIGKIKRGFYCHRALLFKCLADRIDVSCTLVRGEYNRAWNEVLLFRESPSANGCSSQPSRYIVDLMHQPGRLLVSDSPSAVQYQTI